jgi:hypothetical protein
MPKEIIYWKQRNGELINIDKMDITHLRNVLKLLIKRNNKQVQLCPNCNEPKDSMECCGFDATESDIY